MLILAQLPISQFTEISARGLEPFGKGTGSFFPAFTLPSADTFSAAGIWDGTVTGTLMNGQIRLELHQERDMIYGALDAMSGSFPTTIKTIPVYGLVSATEPPTLQNTLVIDTDSDVGSYRLTRTGGYLLK